MADDHQGDDAIGSAPPQANDEHGEVTLTAELIGGRYQPITILGQGTSGVVYRAWDTLNGTSVALKWLFGTLEEKGARLLRELSALRALRLPGVVRFLDEGVYQRRPFIVTELIEGKPFPGCPPTPDGRYRWAAIAETTKALLSSLHRIHERGVIHRDLKPGNVLVDDQGHPVILDFGLARGAVLGSTITGNVILGTPRYVAPEQVLMHTPDGTTRRVDGRADIYAVGVMLYEALAGQPPFPGHDVEAVLVQRVTTPSPPLSYVHPQIDPKLAAIVDRMLAQSPDDRFRSAGAVIAALDDLEFDYGQLPWLGSRATVDEAVRRVSSGESIDITGVQGSGVSRTIEEVVGALVEAGKQVLYLPDGEQPLESLSTLGEGESAPSSERLGQAWLEAQSSRAAILVVDDEQRLDRWTQRLLAVHRKRWPVLRGVRVPPADPDQPEVLSPQSLTPAAITELDLARLFEGPDRLLHLQTDGAALLYTLTRGHPGSVTTEIGAWVGTGMARWIGEEAERRLWVDWRWLQRMKQRPPLAIRPGRRPYLDEAQGTLETLLAWITLAWPYATPERLATLTGQPRWALSMSLAELTRAGAIRSDGSAWAPCVPATALDEWSHEDRQSAHGRIAHLLPPGTPGRLEHLLTTDHLDPVVEESLLTAAQWRGQGAFPEALWSLEEALSKVRVSGTPRPIREMQLLEQLTFTALEAGQWGLTSAPVEALYLVERSELPRAQLGPLLTLLNAAQVFLGQGPMAGLNAHTDDLSAASDEAFVPTWISEEPHTEVALPMVVLEQLDQLPEHLSRDLDVHRLSHLVRRDLLIEPDGAQALFQRWTSLADGAPPFGRRGPVLWWSWQGWQRLHQGAISSAAEAFERAAEACDVHAQKINHLLIVAEARLAAQQFDEVQRIASECRAVAEEARWLQQEARATWLLRASSPRDTAPDEALVQGALSLPQAYPMAADTAAHIVFQEAVFAWRSGHPRVRRWARQAARLWRAVPRPHLQHLAEALLLCSQPHADQAEQQRRCQALAQHLCPVPTPSMALGTPLHITPTAHINGQALAWLVEAAPEPLPQWVALARRRNPKGV
ncbi:MAG: protein kinase domain-containing protein [Bradymonadia bacterium]